MEHAFMPNVHSQCTQPPLNPFKPHAPAAPQPCRFLKPNPNPQAPMHTWPSANERTAPPSSGGRPRGDTACVKCSTLPQGPSARGARLEGRAGEERDAPSSSSMSCKAEVSTSTSVLCPQRSLGTHGCCASTRTAEQLLCATVTAKTHPFSPICALPHLLPRASCPPAPPGGRTCLALRQTPPAPRCAARGTSCCAVPRPAGPAGACAPGRCRTGSCRLRRRGEEGMGRMQRR